MPKGVPRKLDRPQFGLLPMVSNTSRACSTLLLGGFPFDYGSFHYPCYDGQTDKPLVHLDPDVPRGYLDYPDGIVPATFDDFLVDLVAGIKSYEANSPVGLPNQKEVRQFAFICASVQDEQGLVNRYLGEFGFFSTGERVFNLKNETVVRYWMMSIPAFLAKLDDLGLDYVGKKKKRSKIADFEPGKGDE